MTAASLPVHGEEFRLTAAESEDGLGTIRLAVPGMHCGGCIARIERELATLPGVETARANLSGKSVTVAWRGDDTGIPAIVEKLRDTGFDAFPLDTDLADSEEAKANRDLLTRMAVAGFASANVMLLSVSVWSGASDATRDLMHWISALIALPVVVYSGRPFFASALRGLRAGHLNMDAPISLAVILAAAVSLSEVMRGGEDAYFDAAVMLLFLLLIGRWLDRMMRSKARSAARALARLTPRGAWVVDAQGKRDYVPVSELRRGDLVALDAGGRLPVDGIVTEGEGAVDASLVTGESRPQIVTPGMQVDAGTLSLDASLIIRATGVGEDTTLAEIARLCAAAEDRKSRLARLAERAAAIYAPVVHLIALATLIGWLASGADFREAMLAAVAVLIVTCPCALGLAAPMAQAVASGALFRLGIMLKDGSALERLARIDTVVFDKTGVLTHGTPSLVDDGDLTDAELSRACSLAAHSMHPLAVSLARYGATRGIHPRQGSEVREQAGSGVEGSVDGVAVRLGSAEWCGVSAAGPNNETLECWYSEANRPARRLRFDDTLRPGAAQAVADFRAEGVGTTILSGDRSAAVARIAGTLAIGEAEGELRPEDKIARVETGENQGHITLMVGDGINDAPALAAASVSMSPVSGSDVSRTAADLIFTGESLGAVTAAWKIARRTRAVILQNFALAAAYNAIAIPVAASGLAGPLVAAIAMCSSSLLVTLNALRLNREAKP